MWIYNRMVYSEQLFRGRPRDVLGGTVGHGTFLEALLVSQSRERSNLLFHPLYSNLNVQTILCVLEEQTLLGVGQAL